MKDTEASDHACGGAWGKFGTRIYRVDEERARMGVLENLGAMMRMHARGLEYGWAAQRALVENKGNGPAMKQLAEDPESVALLSSRYGPEGLSILGMIELVEPYKSKAARADGVSPQITEMHRVYLKHPDISEWTELYMEEMATFNPEIKHQVDDRVDCTSAALRHLDVGDLAFV